MDRRMFLGTAGVGLLGLLTGCAGLVEASAKQPNIIFVFIDDMGYADPSCFVNQVVSAPDIDQFAVEGARFTQFYVNSPVCSPSRVAGK